MIYFRSDYSQGAHPDVLQALIDSNEVHSDGYGEDEFCLKAENVIKKLIGREDVSVYFIGGGTPTNVITIASMIKPFECVITPRTGHIYAHECGAVEATGHKIIPMKTPDGKLTSELIEEACAEYEDYHTAKPRLVYISNSTELGTIYTKAELTKISITCKKNDLLLYMDGARLGSGLTSHTSDLTIKDIAELTDAFYIGGTKNGALFGEALVVKNGKANCDLKSMIKRNCGMFAKGRLIGVQFLALFNTPDENCLYFEIARKTNEKAKRLKEGIENLGYTFTGSSTSNQIFPILPKTIVRILSKDFFFTEWSNYDENNMVTRFVTSWGTTDEEVDELLSTLSKITSI